MVRPGFTSQAMMPRKITLYHFTDAKNLPSIGERGLVPAPLLAFDRPNEQAVWLTLRPMLATELGDVMLTVQVDLFDRALCDDPEPDPYFKRPGWFIYHGTIPPEKIAFPDPA